MLNAFFDDCRHGIRLYVRTPGSSLIAVLVLAIGLAFVTSFISLYVDLALRSRPGFEASGGLVTVGMTDGQSLRGVPYELVARANREVSSLEATVGILQIRQELKPNRDPINLELVTQGFFDGLRPLLAFGRGFEPSDHDAQAEAVIVLSYSFWQEDFGGDPDVIGKTIEIPVRPSVGSLDESGRQQTPQDRPTQVRVVGVMGPKLVGAFQALSVQQSSASVQGWMPFERAFPLFYGSRSNNLASLRVVARTRKGASAVVVAKELEDRYADTSNAFRIPSTFRFYATRGVVNNVTVQREMSRQLLAFLAGSILLAVVAACNVSLFLLARAPGRRRELGIRLSVGAPMKRLAHQLSREAGVLVAISAVLGLALSVWLNALLRNLAFLRRAEWIHVTLLDWRVLSLIMFLLLLLSVLVSLAPILGLKRLGIAASSRHIAATATLAQRITGTAQLAIAGALAAAAVTFSWYLGSMVFGDAGYQIHKRQVLTFTVPVVVQQAGRTISGVASCLDRSVETSRQRDEILSIPGVSAVSIACGVPGLDAVAFESTTIPDRLNPDESIELRWVAIDENYVDVLGLRLIYGRSPIKSDVDTVLVNETFARRYFGDEDAVGEVVPLFAHSDKTFRIIGVLQDLSFEHPSADVPPMVFAINHSGGFRSYAIIAGKLSTVELRQSLQSLVNSGDLEINMEDVRDLEDLRWEIIAPDRARGLLAIATGVLVVALAGFGFYGIQRYLVAAGRREYAIRASLGAGPRALGKFVFARGLLLGLPGLILGTLLAFVVVVWLRDEYIPRAISPAAVTLCVVFGLFAITLGASFGPARQARRTQVALLLRED